MRIILGHRYRTRDGRETSPIQLTPTASVLDQRRALVLPFTAIVGCMRYYWTATGEWVPGERAHLDLVAPFAEAPVPTDWDLERASQHGSGGTGRHKLWSYRARRELSWRDYVHHLSWTPVLGGVHREGAGWQGDTSDDYRRTP